MKIEKKKALIEKWARCVMTGGSEERNAPCEISQAIADDINAMLNPIPTILIPFYIAELETAATSLRA